MSETKEVDIRDLPGVCATVNLTGSVTAETHRATLEMMDKNFHEGFERIEYDVFPAQLVEAGRDAVCHHALNESYAWCLMYDGDATFPSDALIKLLYTAFVSHPDASVVGAYSQLKGGMNAPTIDTGTGTWEIHFPGEGVLPAIRTGGHFLLIKTEALKGFGPPWFRTRRQKRVLDALREIDNFARIKLHGENPLTEHDAWHGLMDLAMKAADGGESHVGEDSGFADRLHAAGGKLYVDTSVVTGHVAKKVIGPQDLAENQKKLQEKVRLACGIEG